MSTKQEIKDHKVRIERGVRKTVEEVVASMAQREIQELASSYLAMTEDGGYEFELKDLYAPNGKWTPEEKVSAVFAYTLTGTSKQASKLTGIPDSTIRVWKKSAVWWDDVVRECKKAKQDELDARYTQVIHQAVGQIEDRLEKGDVIIDKHGEKHFKPVDAKSLAVIQSIVFGNRALLRGDPTSRTESTSSEDQLKALKDSFDTMYAEVKRVQNTKVIDGEAEVKHDGT